MLRLENSTKFSENTMEKLVLMF